MTFAETTSAVLLIAGVTVVLVSSLGMLTLSNALDRLHCVGLASVAGVGLVVAAVVIAHPLDQFGLKAGVLAATIWCFGPIIAHVQASLAYRIATTDRRSADDQNGARP